MAIPGLWADIAFAEGKSKKKYPTARYAYDKLRLLDMNGHGYSHQTFVASLKTEILIRRASQASDAQKNERRNVVRNQTIARINQELGVAFASEFQRLKDAEQTRADFGDDVRAAIIAALCTAVSMGLTKQSIMTRDGK